MRWFAAYALLALLCVGSACAQFVKKGDLGNKKPMAFELALELTLKEAKGEHEFDIKDALELKTISSLAKHKGDFIPAAKWLEGRLGYAGMQNVKVYATPGGHPIVYGEWLGAGAEKPTVLVYGHYDVRAMPVKDSWAGPFEVTVIQESYFGRGMAGGKGALLMAVQGIEAAIRAAQLTAAQMALLPVNLKMVFEGQGEHGSPDLAAFLKEHALMVAADAVLASVGGPNVQGEAGAAGGSGHADKVAAAVWEAVMGEAAAYNRDPASTPALALLSSHVAPVTVFGWGLGDNIHASNERLKIARMGLGRELWAKLLEALGKPSAVAALAAEAAARAQKSEL
ncbi:hypothetical protein FOA52_000667 [Chlamydomonas sp. UWO 241]|nr:hypothetical protein FOA52_000667 [Chlamydomonas sp. UWO 241]